jgi:Pentapeptide repeats (8 copies)
MMETTIWEDAVRIGSETVRKERRFLLWGTSILSCAAFSIVLAVILLEIPKLQVAQVKDLTPQQQFDAEDAARKTLAQILGGIVILAGGFVTWRTFALAQQGQITDRFTKAIEQLGAVEPSGSKKLEIRLGGIYALERITMDSDRDHWPIIEVLCTYLQQNVSNRPEQPTEGDAPESRPHPAVDIQAILTVLARRNHKFERIDRHLDLRNLALQGANLGGANLGGANLSRTDLQHSYLRLARLDRAHLRGVNLSGAYLWLADLSGAQLSEANLSGADLCRVHFRRANFENANLAGADLSGTDLGQARNLTQAQIEAAIGDFFTKLPLGLRRPESWGNKSQNAADYQTSI